MTGSPFAVHYNKWGLPRFTEQALQHPHHHRPLCSTLEQVGLAALHRAGAPASPPSQAPLQYTRASRACLILGCGTKGSNGWKSTLPERMCASSAKLLSTPAPKALISPSSRTTPNSTVYCRHRRHFSDRSGTSGALQAEALWRAASQAGEYRGRHGEYRDVSGTRRLCSCTTADSGGFPYQVSMFP